MKKNFYLLAANAQNIEKSVHAPLGSEYYAGV